MTSKLLVDFDSNKAELLENWKRKVLGKGIKIKKRVQELIEKDLNNMETD